MTVGVLFAFVTGTALAAAMPQLTPSAASPCAQSPNLAGWATFSDAQLRAYGLPPRSHMEANPATWNALLAHNPKRDCGPLTLLPYGSSVLAYIGPGGGQSSCNPPAPSERCTDDIWDGNETLGSRGEYRVADMTLSVPQAYGSNASQTNPVIAAFWAGMGGDEAYTSPAVLVQTGVVTSFNGAYQTNQAVIDVTGSSFTNYYGAMPLCRVNTHDHVYVEADSNYDSDGYDYFLADNVTANCFWSCMLPTSISGSVTNTCIVSVNGYKELYGNATYNPSYNSDSATGECMAERLRTQAQGSFMSLADWNPIGDPTTSPTTPDNNATFSSCRMNDTNIGSLSHFYYVLTDSSGYTLASVGAISNSNTYNVIWYREQ